MKPRLLELLRCPQCGSPLDFHDAVLGQGTEASEIIGGVLACSPCGGRYPVIQGVPNFCAEDSQRAVRDTTRTASTYGYLWERSRLDAPLYSDTTYHYEKMEHALALPEPRGLVLDAGCGDGIDLMNRAHCPNVEVVGVELSDGGCRTSFQRTATLTSAHVVQADLSRLPFAAGRFDVIYSYGVLHHLAVPKDGLRELVRVAKPGAMISAYLYEDFSDHSIGWRWLLAGANQLRWITTRLPHAVLFGLCGLLSPLVYLCFTVPFHVLRRLPGLRAAAQNIPFRHARGPWSLTGDLYDRFAAPIERRFNQQGAAQFFKDAGLLEVRTAKERGWMVCGIKPNVEADVEAGARAQQRITSDPDALRLPATATGRAC